MIATVISYIFIALMLFLAGGCLFTVFFNSKEEDGGFVVTGLVLAISFLTAAYAFARWHGL